MPHTHLRVSSVSPVFKECDNSDHGWVGRPHHCINGMYNLEEQQSFFWRWWWWWSQICLFRPIPSGGIWYFLSSNKLIVSWGMCWQREPEVFDRPRLSSARRREDEVTEEEIYCEGGGRSGGGNFFFIIKQVDLTIQQPQERLPVPGRHRPAYHRSTSTSPVIHQVNGKHWHKATAFKIKACIN